jgi:hypothetical protein
MIPAFILLGFFFFISAFQIKIPQVRQTANFRSLIRLKQNGLDQLHVPVSKYLDNLEYLFYYSTVFTHRTILVEKLISMHTCANTNRE